MSREDEGRKRMGAESRDMTEDRLEPEMREALGSFKSSVHAWSDAMMSRPREVNAPARTNLGLVTKWALGCVVFVAAVSAGVYQNHRLEEQAKAATEARIAEQQRLLAERQVKEQAAEDLMAKVDSDIARQVPRALEPLASLMNEDESTGN